MVQHWNPSNGLSEPAAPWTGLPWAWTDGKTSGAPVTFHFPPGFTLFLSQLFHRQLFCLAIQYSPWELQSWQEVAAPSCDQACPLQVRAVSSLSSQQSFTLLSHRNFGDWAGLTLTSRSGAESSHLFWEHLVKQKQLINTENKKDFYEILLHRVITSIIVNMIRWGLDASAWVWHVCRTWSLIPSLIRTIIHPVACTHAWQNWIRVCSARPPFTTEHRPSSL